MDTVTEPTITADAIRDAILETRHVTEPKLILFAEPVVRAGDGWFTSVDLPVGAARAIAADEQADIAGSLGVLTCQVILSWLPGDPGRLYVWVGDQPDTWRSAGDIHQHFGLSYLLAGQCSALQGGGCGPRAGGPLGPSVL